MTRKQQIEYWNNYEAFRKPVENHGRKVFRAMLNRQTKLTIQHLLKFGIQSTIEKLPYLISNYETMLVMQTFYLQNGLPFAIREFEQLSGQKSHYILDMKFKRFWGWVTQIRATTFSDIWKKLLLNFVVSNSATKVQGINNTTRNQLKKILTEAINEQKTVAQTATKIRKEMQYMNRWRSANIARTEANTAANYATTIGAESASKLLTNAKLEKFWIATADMRTRDSHLAMLGKPSIPIDDLFLVGGEKLAYPCASGGSAKNVCNCRCVVAHRVVTE